VPELTISITILVIALAFGWWLLQSRKRIRHPVAAGLNEQETIPHSQEFELYHNALSLCSMKTRVCLAELGISYRSHPVDLIETGCYENIRPEFLKINPAGTVPVLVHNGHPVYESHVQILHAAAHAPAGSPSLTPENAEALETMQYWIDQSSIKGDPLANGPNTAGNAIPGLTVPLFSAMVAEIPAWKITEGFLFHFDKRRPFVFFALKLLGLEKLQYLKPALKVHSESRLQMQKYMSELEAQLHSSGGPWILGELFSLADVSWLVIFERLAQADSLHLYIGDSLRPTLTAYWKMLKARPSYQSAILDHQHPTVTRGTARLIDSKIRVSRLRKALDGE
jgi:glutathione S-transferase